jgi:hypothetical protein
MKNQRFFLKVSLAALIGSAVLGTGCVTNGRRLLLKEYGPSVPVVAGDSLKGVIIHLQGFKCAPDLVGMEPTSKPDEVEAFSYTDMTREQDVRWGKEMKLLEKQTKEADWRSIGNMRNGFGMVMSHVYALNDPAVWFAESLKLDLEAQGAKVVDTSQAIAADVSVSGTIQVCRVDMYFVVNGTMVVDIDVQAKKGAPRHKQIHAHGATAAMLASEGEYFHALRDARQKVSLLVIREISDALKQGR